MSSMKIVLAAKTNVGMVRTNNEDNFQVISDISSGQQKWRNNEVFSMGQLGTLLVVADGMGGMNAGEVASALAIDTVKEYFTHEKITPDVIKNRFSIEKFMNAVIVAADDRIKQEAKKRPETSGMGTTIVIGWILEGRLYVSWCGDSRAYIFNPSVGLHQISKDHSYVQSLVDKGEISKEDAFDFPDSNIITRSLSDFSGKAKPEAMLKPYELCNSDIILLCTDGLNGMIRDTEIQRVIANNQQDMSQCVDELIRAACEAAGADNVTVCLCKVIEGGKDAVPDFSSTSDKGYITELAIGRDREPGDDDVTRSVKVHYSPRNIYKTMFYVALGVIVLLLGLVAYLSFRLNNSKDGKDAIEQVQQLNEAMDYGSRAPENVNGDVQDTVVPESGTPSLVTPAAPDNNAVSSNGRKPAVSGAPENSSTANKQAPKDAVSLGKATAGLAGLAGGLRTETATDSDSARQQRGIAAENEGILGKKNDNAESGVAVDGTDSTVTQGLATDTAATKKKNGNDAKENKVEEAEAAEDAPGKGNE